MIVVWFVMYIRFGIIIITTIHMWQWQLNYLSKRTRENNWDDLQFFCITTCFVIPINFYNDFHLHLQRQTLWRRVSLAIQRTIIRFWITMMRVFSLGPSKYMSSLFVPQKNAAIRFDLAFNWDNNEFLATWAAYTKSHICYIPRFLLARAKLNIYEKQMNLNSKVFDSRNN